MSDATHKPVCAVIGVGPGNGAAFASRFAAEGYAVAMLSRSLRFTAQLAAELPGARAYACDVGDAEAVAGAFAAIEAELGAVDVLIFNAGQGVWGDFAEISLDAFEAAWRVNVFGALLCARAVAPVMKRRGAGQIVFVGATASRRGGAKAAAFASAKGGQRNLAESLARALGPAGVHVSLIIIDGVVDEPASRRLFPDRSDSFYVKPDDVADTAVMLTRQKPSAWSFELEARPFGERW
jgi:NAD(P)-dependent dehydrogenase (short-subunit alcohol dehydrogenase family)